MPNTVLVVGLGTAGLRVAEHLLAAGVPVHGLDEGPDAQALHLAVTRGFAVTCGDATNPHVLEQAGIATASALLVMINGDAIALRVGLTARRLRADLRIVLRLFNHSTVEHLPASAHLLGLSLSALVAPSFVAAILLPGLRGAFTMGNTLLGVAVAPPTLAQPIARDEPSTIGPDQLPPDLVRLPTARHDVLIGTPAALRSVLDQSDDWPARGLRGTRQKLHLWGVALRLGWRRSNRLLRRLLAALGLAMAVAVVIYATAGRLSPLDALYFVVSTLTTVGYGDISVLHDSATLIFFDIALMLGGAMLMAIVYAFITDLVVGAKIDRALNLRAALRRNHVVVVGLGSVGYRCALALHGQGIPVVVLDPNEEGRFWQAAQTAGLTLLGLKADSEDALRRAGIEYARALFCATSDDQANVEIGLLARGLRPDLHVVLRVFDPAFAAEVQTTLGIPATFSAPVLAAPAFAAAALDHPNLVPIPTDLPAIPGVHLTLHSVPSPLASGQETVQDIVEPGAVAVALLRSGGRCCLSPAPSAPLQPGESLLLAHVTPP